MAELLATLDCRWNIAGSILAKGIVPSTTLKGMPHEDHCIRRSEFGSKSGSSDAGTGQNFVYVMVSLARMEAKLHDCRIHKLKRGHLWSTI
jgi:hypothetical protein